MPQPEWHRHITLPLTSTSCLRTFAEVSMNEQDNQKSLPPDIFLKKQTKKKNHLKN